MITKSKICIQYALYAIIVTVAIITFNLAFESFLGKESSSSTGALGSFFAALLTGYYYFKHTGKTPSKGERWTYALYFTGIQAFFALIILITIALALPEAINLPIPIILLAFSTALLVALIANRIGFGWGLNDAKKSADKAH